MQFDPEVVWLQTHPWVESRAVDPETTLAFQRELNRAQERTERRFQRLNRMIEDEVVAFRNRPASAGSSTDQIDKRLTDASQECDPYYVESERVPYLFGRIWIVEYVVGRFHDRLNGGWDE